MTNYLVGAPEAKVRSDTKLGLVDITADVKVNIHLMDRVQGPAPDTMTKDGSATWHVDPVIVVIDHVPGVGALSRGLEVRFYEEEGTGFAECEELEAVESGADRAAAFDSLLEFIADDFAYWTRTVDSELTPQARELKDKYLSLRP